MAVIVPTETKSVLHNETLKGFELVNDAAAPGNSKYYGTDGSGTKGFFDLPAGGGVSSDNYYDAGSGGLTDFLRIGNDGNNGHFKRGRRLRYYRTCGRRA
jgi:hypothetical protein